METGERTCTNGESGCSRAGGQTDNRLNCQRMSLPQSAEAEGDKLSVTQSLISAQWDVVMYISHISPLSWEDGMEKRSKAGFEDNDSWAQGQSG